MTKVPTIGAYRGIPLHADQDESRLTVVRADIDDVAKMKSDVPALVRYVADLSKAPEARLFAGALIEAAFAIAAERREIRPDVDIEYVRACVAGLDSVEWRDPTAYGCLIDRAAEDEPQPVPRTVPLTD